MWLVLAGAKGKESVFRSISFENLPPRVYLTGYVPDKLLPAIIAGAKVFLYPSLYEGFGLPPLEAMGCGTPVLTSNTTSLPEVTGDAAFLVNPNDTEAIADGIKQLVENSNLREQLTIKGLERTKIFSWEKTADQTWQVLQEAAEINLMKYSPKIAIIHDWLVASGGAEQVLEAMLEIWQDADIYTIIYDSNGPCKSNHWRTSYRNFIHSKTSFL